MDVTTAKHIPKRVTLDTYITKMVQEQEKNERKSDDVEYAVNIPLSGKLKPLDVKIDALMHPELLH